MRPEIEAYLRDNGAKYTTQALRRQLITAGFEPAEVDAALQESEAARAPRFAETGALRARFWRWAVIVHAAALAAATIWVLQVYGAGTAVLVAMVLGVALLIGLGISGLIGRSLLARGLAVALVVPLLSALLLGGWCMALSRPSLL